MAETTKISWCHHTFNMWRGCEKVSPGCDHCYAEAMSHRNPAVLGEWGPDGARVVAAEAYWQLPEKWDRQAAAAGERRRVFCASLGDVFEEHPDLVEPRRRLFRLIGRTPHLDWLLLTKRPRTAVENWPLWAGYWACEQADRAAVLRLAQDYVLPNVWVGVSVEDQVRADERIPLLLQVPAAVRFLSCEPLLGPVQVDELLVPYGDGQAVICPLTGEWAPAERSPVGGATIDWVIAGGESGPHARPMHRDWARSLRDQCRAAGVPFHFKQWGLWVHANQTVERPWPDRHLHHWPDSGVSSRAPSVERAGRLLDGVEHLAFPEVVR